MRRSAAGSAAPPRALIVSRRRLTVVGADPDSREGPATAWWLIRLRGGSCQIHRITAGTARRTASHRAVAAAMITAAVAGTTATGARAASWGNRGGGLPPVNRPTTRGYGKAVSAPTRASTRASCQELSIQCKCPDPGMRVLLLLPLGGT